MDLGGVGAGGAGAVKQVIDGVIGNDAAEGVTGDVDLIEGGWGEVDLTWCRPRGLETDSI